MAGHFEPTGDGGAAIALDEVEVSILRSLAVQLLELIGPGSEPAPSENGAAGDGSGQLEGMDGMEGVAWPPFADGPTEPPADPALARLFPDAYGPGPETKPDDSANGAYNGNASDAGERAAASAEEARAAAAASAEFRRYTENDLRARKREDGLAVVRALDALTPGEKGAVLTLGPDDSRRWLGTLNDLRLAIGTRLELTDDNDGSELYSLPDSDPRKPMVMAYLWLGGLQETLIETLL
ncbi:DUF2017 domain-containing protein [Streptomyces iconiensis]|uniref:DUF2017 domain-containing protein n=1 Tax=Streptomyces iconiensis TaxID=1384038 RepID=A0ABT6ZVX8_9ACTN|nr:DUF2017 domain-containing protein [Streptomyces iconiensis]MDJ1133234.1 DUF2017 domain-containing protein [Streptomyces iconiensis]